MSDEVNLKKCLDWLEQRALEFTPRQTEPVTYTSTEVSGEAQRFWDTKAILESTLAANAQLRERLERAEELAKAVKEHIDYVFPQGLHAIPSEFNISKLAAALAAFREGKGNENHT